LNKKSKKQDNRNKNQTGPESGSIPTQPKKRPVSAPAKFASTYSRKSQRRKPWCTKKKSPTKARKDRLQSRPPDKFEEGSPKTKKDQGGRGGNCNLDQGGLPRSKAQDRSLQKGRKSWVSYDEKTKRKLHGEKKGGGGDQATKKTHVDPEL